MFRSRIALVATGGFGRRQMAPYSDVDLLLLYHPSLKQEVTTVARLFVTQVSDVGLQWGFNALTVRDACQLAWKDVNIFTSLVESRYIGGSVGLVRSFMREFRFGTTRRKHALVARIQSTRSDERKQFGDTVFLLEPNVKRSRGGLRDIHMLRWVGFVRFFEWRLDRLQRDGVLSAEDRRALEQGQDFLLRVRNELHFHEGRSQDILRRSEQARIAAAWHYSGTEGVLPVEQFMRDYFAHSNAIRHAVDNFVANIVSPSWMEEVLRRFSTHRFDRYYLVSADQVRVTAKGLASLRGNLAEILRLMELCSRSRRRIAQETWYAIRDDLIQRKEIEVTPATARQFMQLLQHGGRLGPLLRLLHEVRALEKFIVGLDRARHLVQFNNYHHYTIDEHCILAVERATEFEDDPGPLGIAYRALKERPILHLALLIHDLGKGYPEDHSIVGARLARQTADRLGLDAPDQQLLEFLVAKHLLMAHVALRRDITDKQTIVQFATEVGSLECLRTLYLLTAADLAAVGPNTLTPWKQEVLTELFRRTQTYLSGAHDDSESEAQARRRAVLDLMPQEERKWFEIQVKSLPGAYVLENDLATIATDLHHLQGLVRDPIQVWGRFSPERGVAVYCMGFRAGRARGTFHRIALAFSNKGMNILAAYVYTLANQSVLARIYAADPDYPGEPPPERFREVEASLLAAVQERKAPLPTLAQRWQDAWKQRRNSIQTLPTRVVIDQTSHPDYTILDIFAHDRVGLLFTIAKTLFDLGLIVHFAKVSTHLDQVVSAFYVTNARREKLQDSLEIAKIQAALMHQMEAE